MDTPYRDAPPSDDDDDAIIAKIRPPERLLRGLLLRTAFTLVVIGTFAYLGDTESITAFLVRYYIPVLFAGAILFLEMPVRRWLERRYARKVARGIIDLEVRASRVDSKREA